MMSNLQANIGNTELLANYGYEPCDDITVAQRWQQLSDNWSPDDALELGLLRQVMLQIHLECCPDDARWRQK